VAGLDRSSLTPNGLIGVSLRSQGIEVKGNKGGNSSFMYGDPHRTEIGGGKNPKLCALKTQFGFKQPFRGAAKLRDFQCQLKEALLTLPPRDPHKYGKGRSSLRKRKKGSFRSGTFKKNKKTGPHLSPTVAVGYGKQKTQHQQGRFEKQLRKGKKQTPQKPQLATR